MTVEEVESDSSNICTVITYSAKSSLLYSPVSLLKTFLLKNSFQLAFEVFFLLVAHITLKVFTIFFLEWNMYRWEVECSSSFHFHSINASKRSKRSIIMLAVLFFHYRGEKHHKCQYSVTSRIHKNRLRAENKISTWSDLVKTNVRNITRTSSEVILKSLPLHWNRFCFAIFNPSILLAFYSKTNLLSHFFPSLL